MWWTKVADKGTEKHKTKLDAMIRLNFAHHLSAVPHAGLALYKRDPDNNPGEPNVFAAMLEAQAEKQREKIAADIRSIMSGKKRGRK